MKMNTANLITSTFLISASAYAYEPCYVKNLGGTQPDQICHMRNFLKAYEKQTHPFPGKNALLIYGPLGTGKTLAAKAIGKEADVHVIFYDLKDKFLEGPWIGLKIKEIYQEAEKAAQQFRKPVVIILDDIDQISGLDKSRFTQQEIEALAEVCNQIQQHAHCSYIVTILATAKVTQVNKELQECCIPVKIGTPDQQNRFEIIKFYATKHKLDLPETLCREFAQSYSDFSGRFIEVAFSTAKTLAAGRNKDKIDEALLREAFERKRRLHDDENSMLYILWRSIYEWIGLV